MFKCLGLTAAIALGVAVASGSPHAAGQVAPGRTAGQPQTATAQRNAVSSVQASDTQGMVSKYCAGCHNERLKSGGLSLAALDAAHLTAGAETWEKVIRKLRTGAMPPPGAPRPDAAQASAVAGWLEAEIDRAAAISPEPGKLPNFRRLTRTEYQNAVRDLLGLDVLPKDMDYSVLLPGDNASSGFDNIADLLFVSPAVMERYLDAARKISRIAVGDPSMPVLVSSYRMSGTRPQDARIEELPFGTRGGLAIHTQFPLDGEYLFTVEPAGGGRDAQQIEINIDGARVHLFETGGPAAGGRGGGRGRGAAPPPADSDQPDDDQADTSAPAADPVPAVAPQAPATAAAPGTGQTSGASAGAPGAARGRGAGAGRGGGGNGRGAAAPAGRGRGGGNRLEARLEVTAGPHLVGVTFVERSEARDESTVRPRLRGRGTQPAIGAVTITGPENGGRRGDTPSRRRIFTCRPSAAAEELPCAKKVLLSLARRAYRRPVSDADLQDLLPFYTAGRAAADFDEGIQRAVERLLVSPQFLYRIEQNPARAAAGTTFRISDLELASRLSFFIWSSIPDDELLTVAERGRLREPAVLAQQVKRMLADSRASSLVTNFASQWLFLRDVEAKRPDEILFPDYDDTLRDAFREETELFLGSVIHSQQSVLALLTADYTYLNERLARHYGIPQVKGAHFRKVTFPPGSPRGGLLGQGSILTLTSYATRTSPVLRGKWILDNVLATPPPPPPPDVPALKVEHENKPRSIREALIEHRANPVCASCHSRMDPLGFALENFDAVGRWRDFEAVNRPIDASAVMPDGHSFRGAAELKRLLVQDPGQFVHTVAEKLMMYALGRNVQYYDAPAIRAILRTAAPAGNTFESLVLGVVRSAPFQMRKVQADEAGRPNSGVRQSAAVSNKG